MCIGTDPATRARLDATSHTTTEARATRALQAATSRMAAEHRAIRAQAASGKHTVAADTATRAPVVSPATLVPRATQAVDVERDSGTGGTDDTTGGTATVARLVGTRAVAGTRCRPAGLAQQDSTSRTRADLRATAVPVASIRTTLETDRASAAPLGSTRATRADHRVHPARLA